MLITLLRISIITYILNQCAKREKKKDKLKSASSTSVSQASPSPITPAVDTKHTPDAFPMTAHGENSDADLKININKKKDKGAGVDFEDDDDEENPLVKLSMKKAKKEAELKRQKEKEQALAQAQGQNQGKDQAQKSRKSEIKPIAGSPAPPGNEEIKMQTCEASGGQNVTVSKEMSKEMEKELFAGANAKGASSYQFVAKKPKPDNKRNVVKKSTTLVTPSPPIPPNTKSNTPNSSAGSGEEKGKENEQCVTQKSFVDTAPTMPTVMVTVPRGVSKMEDVHKTQKANSLMKRLDDVKLVEVEENKKNVSAEKMKSTYK